MTLCSLSPDAIDTSLTNERVKLRKAPPLFDGFCHRQRRRVSRRVTPEQLTNFVFLTQKVTKIPITVSIGQEGSDTESFAYQLRSMLSQAGFGIAEVRQHGSPFAGVGPLGIYHDPLRRVVSPIGLPNYLGDVLIASPQDVRAAALLAAGKKFMRFEQTNNFLRPIVESTNKSAIYSGIGCALIQVGIKTLPWVTEPGT